MSARLRLLLTISDLAGGGAEREMANLARGLPRDRFELHLLLHRPVFTHPAPEDVAVHLVARTRPWHTPRAVRGIRRAIEAIRPDLVFSQLHYTNLLTGTALSRARHRPRWVCRHTGDPRRELRGPFAWWARHTLARADRVVGCSEGVSRALREHLRLPTARVATLPNVVDTDGIAALSRAPLPIRRDPAVFTVVHAGRLVAAKNQALLLEAFAALDEPKAELWMLGDGPLRGRLAARACTLGIARRVRWLGFQANPFPFLRAADVFALSSDREGLPNAVIEAALCGTPSVATRCAYGPEELIEDGVTGRLTPVGDAPALTAALGELARSRPLAHAMGRRAREVCARRFATAASCAAYTTLFEELAGSSRRGS